MREYCEEFMYNVSHYLCKVKIKTTGVNSGGMGGGDVFPHTFFGWGDGLYKYPPPPTFWRKDNLKFDIYCKEMDLFNCKTIKNF